ncbi:MAG: hypothetical protein PHE61_02810 [Candidatus Omnitrophica bacterium]|nr:hypothetical protein [Candidatus Omnitrophota bacterium]
MEERKEERRSLSHLLIVPSLQKFYALVIVIILVVTFILIFISIRITIEDTRRTVMLSKSTASAYEILSKIKEDLLYKIGWIFIPSFIIAGGLGIYLIHRVAGPAYRLHRLLEHIAKGELPNEVKFRQTDFLKDLAADLNTIVLRLKEEHGDAERLIGMLERYKAEINDEKKRAEVDSIIATLRKI